MGDWLTGWVIVYSLVCGFVGLMAERRNRSGILWFIISYFIFPLFAIVALLIMGKKWPSAEALAECAKNCATVERNGA